MNKHLSMNKHLNITEFMEIEDYDKEKYFLRTYPSNDKSEFYDFDIKVFRARDLMWDQNRNLPTCEHCEVKANYFIGTSDIREPKFCFNCYIKINQDSEFIPIISCENCIKCGETICGNDTENLKCYERRL